MIAKLAADLEAAEFQQAKFEYLNTQDTEMKWLVTKLVARFTREADEKRAMLLAMIQLEKDHDT